MGSKHASVHIRCDDYEYVLSILKKKFNKKSAPNKKDLFVLEFIKAVANSNIDKITDKAEKAEKLSVLEDIIGRATEDMGNSEPAVIVVRPYFVSVYWYDHIRSENLATEAVEYSSLCNAPVLGVAVYDDSNFQIYAVSCMKGEPSRGCKGEYFFDHNDITTVAAEEVCDIVNTPFWLSELTDTLSLKDGENMVASFEDKTGIIIFMNDDFCMEQQFQLLHSWTNGKVYNI